MLVDVKLPTGKTCLGMTQYECTWLRVELYWNTV